MKVVVEKSKSEKRNLLIEVRGKLHPVYSHYCPEKDGQRFYGIYGTSGTELCIFIGLGLGYHIDPFLKDQRVKRIVVLEPEGELYRTVRNYDEVRVILLHEKVELYLESDIEQYIESIRFHYDYLFYSGFQVLSFKPLRDLFKHRYNSIEGALRKSFSSLVNEGLTIGRFARIWINNFFRNVQGGENLKLVSALYDTMKGTAVLAGAGPSLDRVYGDLKKYRRAFFIIATDASVKPLIRNGIRPDIMINIDPQPSVFFHFNGLSRSELEAIPIVLNFLSYPQLFSLFKEKYLYFTNHPTTAQCGNTLSRRKTTILNYRAVSSLAFKLSVLMGFQRIVLVGFDFSYPGLRAYARGTYFYDSCLLHSWRLNTFFTMEAHILKRGHTNLDMYREELESVIYSSKKQRELDVINWSEIGAEISGTKRVCSPVFSGKPEKTITERPDLLGAVPDPCKGGELQNVVLTLAIRYSIYKHLPTYENALREAEEYLKRKCDYR